MSFAPVRLDGGGCANVHARSSTGVLVAGADTQGFFLSTNNATSWTVENKGIGKSPHWRQCAALLWSLTETSPPVIYAGVGETGSGGGLLAGTYSGGHLSWALRSGVPQWAGNQAGGNFVGPNAGWQRPTGRLLYQDASFLFAGTFKQGVLRSATGGNDDFPVACQMAGAAPGTAKWYCQCISPDPNTVNNLWAGFYDIGGAGAGLWKCANAHAGTPNFTQVAGGPAIVLDIFPVGDYLYVAAAGQGVYRYGPLSGSPAWANLNGSSVPNPGGTTSDWWSNVCGYVDGSSNHVVIIGNSNNSTPSQCLMRLVIPSNYPTGSITYSNEAASVQTATEPPGYTWWHHGGSYQNWLGGTGYFCPFVTIDASGLPTVNMWCAGSEGSFRNLAGAGWQLANSGMPQFLGHPVAANPVHPGHVVFGDSDWCVFDDTAPGTETQATLLNDKLPGGNQGQALCFSPDGATVYGSQGAKYSNSGGDACSRPWNAPASWTSLHLGSAADGAHSVSGKVAIGMAAFDDASGVRTVLAAVWGSGMWRWQSALGWKFKNATIAAGGSAGNQVPVTYYGGGLVFVYDRKTGIWRSNDYGLTWTLVWNNTSSDVTSGTVAYDVTRTGRLWVSSDGQLFKLSGADTGTVAGGGVTGSGSAVTPAGTQAGPVACDALGNFYYVTQDQGSGAGFLLSSDDGHTFTDIVGDGSFGRCNCNPEFIAIGPIEVAAGAPRIYVSGSNVVAQGYPAGSPVGGGGTSSAFTERQGSLNHAGLSGVLSLWFDQGAGAASLAGSMLSARLECSDGTATFTAPPGWQLDQDIAANPASTTTARAMVWSYAANPGGLCGSQSYTATNASPCVLTVTGAAPANGTPVNLSGSLPTGFTANTVYYVVASSGSTFELAATVGGAAIGSTTAVTTGGILAFPQVFTCSNTAAAFKGKVFEYTTPAGTVQFADQAGGGSATTSATSLPATAGGANNYTGGLAVANFAAYWSVAPSGQSWTTPAGWSTDIVGVGNNTTLSFATYSQTGITAGPTTITGVIVPGSGGTMTSWASGVVTYYAAAGSPVSVTTTSLPNGTLGTAYSRTLAAAGGTSPYTWAVTAGALPTSLTLHAATGVIDGTPTVGGPFTFTVTVTDSLAQAATATFTVTIATAITITTTSPLPAGVTGTDYGPGGAGVTLAASGGTSPYRWALTAGAMPPGINLDTGAGVIAGQPLAAGTYAFTITATDSLAATTAKALTMVTTTGPLTILTTVLAPGRLGQPYTAQLTASGGTPPYTWSIPSSYTAAYNASYGASPLPPGLTLNSSGAITGTLLAPAGDYPFTAQVTDSS
jgi:hypothetical protein